MNKYNEIEVKTAQNLLKDDYRWIKTENPETFIPGKKVCTAYVPIFDGIKFGDEPTSLESIVHPQILDDAEKKYLSAVIKPFRDRIKYIGKGFVDDWVDYARCYIYIVCTDANDDMTFPAFREIDMYKGMEINRKYTLKELGL